ncbi:TPA: hypothetical protein ACPZF8_000891 [Yersinia enterocolitica]|uniref:hypothetical protein n=1 Tax=Yersinia enterocolitica TaxID=630 RepID=UPI000B28F4B8|nr:hypothetical protein [Yersinia enterocolitica]
MTALQTIFFLFLSGILAANAWYFSRDHRSAMWLLIGFWAAIIAWDCIMKG